MTLHVPDRFKAANAFWICPYVGSDWCSAADGAALFNHRFGPCPCVFVNQSGPVRQVIQIALNDAPIRGMLVEWVGGKFARLGQCVQGDLFPALVEDTDLFGLPAHPDLPLPGS